MYYTYMHIASVSVNLEACNGHNSGSPKHMQPPFGRKRSVPLQVSAFQVKLYRHTDVQCDQRPGYLPRLPARQLILGLYYICTIILY